MIFRRRWILGALTNSGNTDGRKVYVAQVYIGVCGCICMHIAIAMARWVHQGVSPVARYAVYIHQAVSGVRTGAGLILGVQGNYVYIYIYIYICYTYIHTCVKLQYSGYIYIYIHTHNTICIHGDTWLRAIIAQHVINGIFNL